jgi:hypothetical protein
MNGATQHHMTSLSDPACVVFKVSESRRPFSLTLHGKQSRSKGQKALAVCGFQSTSPGRVIVLYSYLQNTLSLRDKINSVYADKMIELLALS